METMTKLELCNLAYYELMRRKEQEEKIDDNISRFKINEIDKKMSELHNMIVKMEQEQGR